MRWATLVAAVAVGWVGGALSILFLPDFNGTPSTDAGTQAEARSDEEQNIIAAAEDLVRISLRDPDSAQFREVQYIADAVGFVATPGGGEITRGPAVCGFFNARNAYGGFAGYKRFVVWPLEGPTVNTEEDKYFVYPVACGPDPIPADEAEAAIRRYFLCIHQALYYRWAHRAYDQQYVEGVGRFMRGEHPDLIGVRDDCANEG